MKKAAFLTLSRYTLATFKFGVTDFTEHFRLISPYAIPKYFEYAPCYIPLYWKHSNKIFTLRIYITVQHFVILLWMKVFLCQLQSSASSPCQYFWPLSIECPINPHPDAILEFRYSRYKIWSICAPHPHAILEFRHSRYKIWSICAPSSATYSRLWFPQSSNTSTRPSLLSTTIKNCDKWKKHIAYDSELTEHSIDWDVCNNTSYSNTKYTWLECTFTTAFILLIPFWLNVLVKMYQVKNRHPKVN